MRFSLPLIAILAVTSLAAPLAAKDSLGVFGGWGAFRDPETPLCYAIAAANQSTNRRDFDPYASIGTWPDRQIRGQVHFRLSRELSSTPRIRLAIGGERFELTGGGSDAWAGGSGDEAAILAAMRAGSNLSISATDNRGNRFTDRYTLEGAATAMDAASIGCSGR